MIWIIGIFALLILAGVVSYAVAITILYTNGEPFEFANVVYAFFCFLFLFYSIAWAVS